MENYKTEYKIQSNTKIRFTKNNKNLKNDKYMLASNFIKLKVK